MKDNHSDAKGDLFACFIERGFEFAKSTGYVSMITMESWMFLSSFEKMRQRIVSGKTILNMVHMPYLGKGGTSLGINFGTAAVVFTKHYISNYASQYDYICYYETDEDGVPFQFPTINERYKIAKSADFSKIPGSPIAYWVGNQFITLYDNSNFTKEFSFKRGIATGDNDRFLRLWFEVCCNKIGSFSSKDTQKWFPYNKGGEYRRWYGNREYLINWECDGEEIRNYEKNRRIASRPQNISYNFSENISYSSLTSGALSFRHYVGFINDQAGNFFIKQGHFSYCYGLALLNSVVASYCIQLKNSTLNTTGEDFSAIPICEQISSIQDVEHLASENEGISREDWDAYETSWDFKRHPLV